METPVNSKINAPLPSVAALDHTTRTNKILKSQEDNREYLGLRLSNGLKVLLVSDPTTDKSAAALAVQVG